MLLALARGLRLFTPGRGSIHAEEVELASAPAFDAVNANVAAPDGVERPGERLARLALASAVVQRGRGNGLARALLERGTAVPSVDFGIGTGLRRHGATMDQIIGAIDELKGHTAWRRRAADGDARPPRHVFAARLNVTLVGHEGTADRLVAAAMRAGAGVLVDALHAGGAFGDDVGCVVETKPLPNSFTFVEAPAA